MKKPDKGLQQSDRETRKRDLIIFLDEFVIITESQPPMTTPIPTCSKPEDPENGKVICEEINAKRFLQGDVCTYECNKGEIQAILCNVWLK